MHSNAAMIRVRAVAAAALLLCTCPLEAAEDPRRDAVVRAVEKARPAVVNINAEEEAVRSNPFAGFADPFFEGVFEDFFERSPRRRSLTKSLGSGVIIDPEGYILTNEHVVARASRIRVTLADERSFQARIVGSDPDHDLAVLKVDAPGEFPFLDLRSREPVLIGEKVIAIGNPFGLSHTVTTGVVSADRRSVKTSRERVYYDFIQTDAAINPGNSGGPLLDITGAMIGINTAIHSEGYGIGFAIPADVARRVVEDLVRYGEVHAVWLGLAAGDLREEGSGEEDDSRGVAVLALLEGGPGEKAGLRRGDVISRVGEEAIRSAGEFHFRVGNYSDGDLVPLGVRRGTKEIDFVVAAELPGAEAAGRILREWFGFEVRRDRRGMLVLGVRKGGAADRVGLRSGDLVLEIEGAKAGGEEEVEEAVIAAGRRGKAVMLVQRGRLGYYVPLAIPRPN